MKRRGWRRWSTKAAYEVLRRQFAIQTEGGEFKFDLRELRAEG